MHFVWLTAILLTASFRCGYCLGLDTSTREKALFTYSNSNDQSSAHGISSLILSQHCSINSSSSLLFNIDVDMKNKMTYPHLMYSISFGLPFLIQVFTSHVFRHCRHAIVCVSSPEIPLVVATVELPLPCVIRDSSGSVVVRSRADMFLLCNYWVTLYPPAFVLCKINIVNKTQTKIK